jgi:hypothetical protein
VAPGVLGAPGATAVLGATGALAAPGTFAASAGDAASTATAASAGAPPDTSARDAGIGMRTVSPRDAACVPFQPLAASSRLKETPLAAATPAKVSPRRRR